MSKYFGSLIALTLLIASPLLAAVNSATDADFKDKSARGVVIVDLYADWCGPCKKFGPIFDRVSNQFGDKATFLKVNIDNSPNLTRQYGVSSIPTVLIFKDGKKVDQRTGVFSEEQFRSMVQGVVPR